MPLVSDESVKEIKRTAIIAPILIIVFSAALDGNLVAKQAGANYSTEKPFDVGNLTTLMHLY